MMEIKLNEIYGKIANTIYEAIPVEWDMVYYLGEIEKDTGSKSSMFYFVDSSSGKVLRGDKLIPEYLNKDEFNVVLATLTAYLEQLYSVFLEWGQEPWDQFVLFFNNAGAFEIKYNYDALYEYDPELRERVWAHETFGYMGEEGSHCRNLINEYLEIK